MPDTECLEEKWQAFYPAIDVAILESYMDTFPFHAVKQHIG